MKKIMVIMFLLTVLCATLVFGLGIGWRYDAGRDNQGSLATGDIVFSTYNESSFQIANYTYYGTSQALIDEIWDGNTRQEIVVHGLCGIVLLDGNLTQISNYSFCDSFPGRNITSMALADWNNDGDMEIFYVASDSTQGYARVLDVYSNGSMTNIFSGTTTYQTFNKHPVCDESQGYCYVQDINSNIYRFQYATGTRTQINIGSLSGEDGEVYLAIDDCDPNNDGNELITYGDFDGDGHLNDIALVNLSNFNWYARTFLSYGVADIDINAPVTCGKIQQDTKPIVTVSSWGFQYDYGFTACDNYMTLHFLNASTLSTLGYRYQTLDNVGGSPDPSYCDYHARISTPIYDFYEDTVCSYIYNAKAPYSQVRCFNDTSTATLNSFLIGSTSVTSNVANKGYAIRVDTDDDSAYEMILADGQVMDVSGASIVIQKHLYDQSHEWSATQDQTTFADFIARMTPTTLFYQAPAYNGTYMVYTDTFGNVTPTNPLPIINSMTASPSPANESQLVEWTMNITNGDPENETKSAFDCNDDGSLEFAWANRGSNIIFNCTYSVFGNYTVRGWASDDANYPSNVSNLEGIEIIEQDALPYFISYFPVPNPQNVNLRVDWLIQAGDDATASELKSAFDCEDDGSLEYVWDNRGSFSLNFSCNYTSPGNYTSRARLSDNGNYPINVTATDTVEILSTGGGGGNITTNCTGFTAPVCVGTCYFYDDFSYEPYSVACNGWSGMTRSPTSGSLYLKILNSTEQLYLDKTSTSINEWDYYTFNFEFDFKNNNNERVFFYIYDKDINNIITYMYWENNVLYAVTSVSPFIRALGNYSGSSFVNVEGLVDFRDESVTYYYDGGSGNKMYFTDSGTTTAGAFYFNWLYNNLVDFKIDNFRITYGVENVNGTAPTVYNLTEGDSYLDTGNFCAINWTNHTFVESECVVRGYSTLPELQQLCLVRACINDIFTYVYVKAQLNIIKTLIIVIALILLAPLLIKVWVSKK